MAKPKKQAGRKLGCSTCRLRRLKCDETLPICQRCKSSGRECKGLRGTASAPQTLTASNTSPAANMSEVTAISDHDRPSAERPTDDAPGLEEVQTETSMSVGACAGQKEEHIQDPRQKMQPNGQGDDLAEAADMSCRVSAVAEQHRFENALTGKRAADALSLPEARTLPSAKRARRNTYEWEGGDRTKEDKRTKLASASNASEDPLQPDRRVPRAGLQILSKDHDAVQAAEMALSLARPTDAAEHRRSESPQDNIPCDSRVELNCRLPYYRSSDGTSQQTQPPNESTCTDQQPSATECSRDCADGSHSLSHNSQQPLNASASIERDRQSLVGSPVPVELEQDPRKARNSQEAVSSSRKALKTERVSVPSESHTFRISSVAQNGQSPEVGSSFRSMTQSPTCPDLPRAPLYTRNQTSVKDQHAESQSLELSSAHIARDSHSSNRLNVHHNPEPVADRTQTLSSSVTRPAAHREDSHQALLCEQSSSQRNESGSDNAIGALGRQGDPIVNHYQQQFSASNPNPGISASQMKRPTRHLLPTERNSHASSSGHSPQPQSTCRSPAVVFTLENSIQTSLPMARVELLVGEFSRNCTVFLGPQKTTTAGAMYPVDVIMWQRSPDFYRWYVAETRTAKVSALRFELFDANGKLEKVFAIPVDDLYYFQMLKQCIWDSFWAASELNHAPAHFTILVKPAPHRGNRAVLGDSVAAKQMNVMTSVRQTSFAAFSPKPNHIATVPQGPFSPVQTTRNPAHGIPVSIVTQIPPRHESQNVPHLRNPSSQRALTTLPATAEIFVRLQTDGAGKISNLYSKWVLRSGIASSDFFAWFASETGRGEGPPSLRFTFKDAMPRPMSSTIAQGNEDHFDLMKRELRTQFDRAREYVPNLREFVILVTDPQWVLEEDDW